MKKEKKIYLEDQDITNLKYKAERRSICGRGWLSDFIRLLAREEFIFLNEDTKKFLSFINLNIGTAK